MKKFEIAVLINATNSPEHIEAVIEVRAKTLIKARLIASQYPYFKKLIE